MNYRYIVSDEYKFVYFEIPKVACSSIKVALLPLFDLDRAPYTPAQTSQNNDPPVRIHKLFADSDYQVHGERFLKKLRGGEYGDYFKFAFVRNPWDRLVSCWRHKLSEKNSPGLQAPPKVAKSVYAGMPFSEFVEIVADTPDVEANLHFKSQSSAIYGGSEVGNEQRLLIDFNGSFENMQKDFEEITRRLDLKHKLELGHFMRRNKESRPYADFYDDKLKDLVHERYLEDVRNFGYSF